MTTNHNTPFLLIETPRAGKLNYRHIASPNLWMNQQQVLAIIEAAREKKEGKNFLAVGHDNIVKQFDGNRAAPELLILAGINTKSLSGQEKQALRDSLKSLLGQVDKLVTQEVDWNTEGENDLVKRKELTFWFEKYFKDTKHLVWKPRNKQLPLIAVGGIAAMIIIGAIGFKLWPSINGNLPQPISADETKQKLDIFFQICGTPDSEQVEAKNELIQLNLLSQKQDGKLELVNPIDDNKISQIAANPSSVAVDYIMSDISPEKQAEIFDNLFGQSQRPLSGLGNLVSCRNKVRKFTGKPSDIYTPFMKKSEIDELETMIATHRQNNRQSYKVIIGETKSLLAVCGKDVPNLKFIKQCYERWAKTKLDSNQLEDELLDFWGKTKNLLAVCKEVIPPQ